MRKGKASPPSETVSKPNRISEELKDSEKEFHYEGTITDITGCKKAEEVSESSDERLRVLFEFAPDAYYLNDPKGNFIDGNRAAEEMTGFKRDELIGKSFLKLKLLSPKQTPKAAALLAKNALGQPTGPDEFTLNRKDGSQVTVEIRTLPVKIRDKTLVLGIARDISERKKMEEELRESEERYRTLMEDAPVGICNVDLEGTFTFVNKRFEEASGYLRSQVIGKNAFTLGMFNDETLKILAERIKSKLKGEATRPLDVPFRRRDGEWIWVELEARVIKKDATPVGFQLISRDITERKKMVDAICESEEKTRSIFASSPDAIIVIDLSANIVDCNQAALEMYGYSSKDEAIGKSGLMFVAKKDHEKALEGMKRALEGVSRYVEYSLLTKDGREFPAELSAAVMRDASGNPAGFVIVAKDITERKKMEHEIRTFTQFLGAAVNNSPDLIFIKDRDLRYVLASDAACDFAGRPREEIVGRTAQDLYPRDFADGVERTDREVLEKGAVVDVPQLRSVRGEEPRMFHTRKAPLRDASGNITHVISIARDVTERKRMEDELRRSEQRFRKIFQSSPIPALITSIEGPVLDVNDAWVRMTGYSREEAIGHSTIELGIVPDPGQRDRILKDLLEKGRLSNVEITRRTKSGELRDLLNTIELVELDGQKRILNMQVDITHRKRMEETLKQSEMKLKALHRHARTLSVAKSIEEVAKHTLDAMEFTLGFDVADFCAVENEEIHVYGSRGVQRSPLKWPLDGPGVVVKSVNAKRTFRIPDTREEPSFVDRRGFSGTQELQPMFSELAVPVLKDDEAVAVLNVESSRLNAFTDEDQELLETLAMHIASALGRLKQVDTLERAVEERASELKASEEKYRRLVDNITDVVFTIDLKGNFTFCSPATEMMTGYSVQQLLSMNMKELIAPEHFPEIQERLQARIQGERYLPPHQFEIIKADGKRIPVEMTTTRVVEKGTLVGIQGIARDITERRQMEKKLREAERLAAIGETTAMVGHDLRNPLTGITGAVYILKTISNMKKDSKAKEFLDLIEINVQYSNKIISDLLDYSAELHLNLTATNPKSIITDSLRFVPIPENIQVTDLSRSDTQLIADAEKLRRVAVNLITNAVDAMPEGGTLTISSRQSNNDVEIAFSDTGIGMTKETIEKLGTPLLTTKAKGMGFGMAIVKRIVEAHGGSVFVETSAGRGSTFRVKLPIEPELKEVNKT